MIDSGTFDPAGLILAAKNVVHPLPWSINPFDKGGRVRVSVQAASLDDVPWDVAENIARADARHIVAANPAAIIVWGERHAANLARIAVLEGALREARRAIGDHFAPHDCYTTGPLTGDRFRDLVQCPACSAIVMHDAALAGSAVA